VALSLGLGPGPVALDTAIFIYFIEEHPRHLSAVERIFAAVAAGRLQTITSTVTLLETLVIAYRSRDMALAERYEALLSGSRGLRMVELERPLLRLAARLRARLRVKTPDALQIAAALATRCTAFVTGDRRLPAVPGLRIVQLAELT
jgi:predicted nucleic acid-binding protein